MSDIDEKISYSDLDLMSPGKEFMSSAELILIEEIDKIVKLHAKEKGLTQRKSKDLSCKIASMVFLKYFFGKEKQNIT